MTNKIQEMEQKLAELKAQQEMEEVTSSFLLKEENTTEEEFSIEALLNAQKEEVKKDSFEKEFKISEYNEKRFNSITETIKNKINKEVWNEFSFGSISGKILGILRTLNFEFKHRESLCAELGISPMLVDMYYQHAGNAPYYSKTGEIIPARPMNIEITRQLVKRTGTALNIIVSNADLSMINEKAEEARNASALQRAEDTKENGGDFKANVKEDSTFTQNVNIEVNQKKENKVTTHLEGVLDA